MQKVTVPLLFLFTSLGLTHYAGAGLVTVTNNSVFYNGSDPVIILPGYTASVESAGTSIRSFFQLDFSGFSGITTFTSFDLELYNVDNTAPGTFTLYAISYAPPAFALDASFFSPPSLPVSSVSGLAAVGTPVPLSFDPFGLLVLNLAVNNNLSVILQGVYTGTTGGSVVFAASETAGRSPSVDFQFTTDLGPAAVPEPASLAFLGLIGSVAGFRSMRRAKKKVLPA